MTSNDPRADPQHHADERTTLTEFLRWQRQTLEWKCHDLDVGKMAARAVPPSSMSLLGMVRHLADVERSWFRRVMAGQQASPLFWSETDPDGEFDNAAADPALVDGAWAAWRAEVEFAEAFVAGAPDLEVLGQARRGAVSLRYVLVHMIEEYARHNGHADLLRERIDGTVGE